MGPYTHVVMETRRSGAVEQIGFYSQGSAEEFLLSQQSKHPRRTYVLKEKFSW